MWGNIFMCVQMWGVFIFWNRVWTNCCSCLLDDNQDSTAWESLQYMISLFIVCSVLFRNANNFAPKSAANSSSYGNVCVFTGDMLVLAIRNVLCISQMQIPLRYATAALASLLLSQNMWSCVLQMCSRKYGLVLQSKSNYVCHQSICIYFTSEAQWLLRLSWRL